MHITGMLLTNQIKTVSAFLSVCERTFAGVRLSGMKSLTTAAVVGEEKIEVDGVNINYIKVGQGPHHVLCMPGALGTIWTDFKPQIDHLNRSKFTIVVWDPPGYGKSIPPKRDFSPGFYYRDSAVAVKLMQKLGISRYSLLGWSNGGISSIITAANCPENIIKLAVWGSNTYFNEEEAVKYQAFRDHSLLSPKLKAPYIAVYGEKCYDELWTSWIDASVAVSKSETKGDICKLCLPKISCPTLILHGAQDFNIAPEHPHYIKKNIKNSRLHIFEEGKHHIHLKYWEEFNSIIEKFLLENESQCKM